MEGLALAWRVMAAVGTVTAVVAIAGFLIHRIAAHQESAEDQ